MVSASSRPPPLGDWRPIVGREPELAALVAGLSAALAGRGRLFLISGEPGIGKTRLGDELSAIAEDRGARVLFGRAWESGGAPAFFPWLDVLASLAAPLPDATLAATLGEGAAQMGDLVPAVRARLGTPAPVSGSLEEARFRLFRAVSALLRRGAGEHGMVVVLEDLHAADESSLSLLHFVARELRSQRVLVVGTFRDVEARSTPEVEGALGRLSREATTLHLARLGPEDAARFVETESGALSDTVVRTILARSQGNPLFLAEMVRLVSSDATPDVAALPLGVSEVIRGRLGRLSRETLRLLELSAVTGDETTAAFVAEASGLAVDVVGRAFAEAVRGGVVVSRPEARFRFSHALMREVLVRDLSADRRAELHGAVAHSMERRAVFQEDPPLSKIAHHLLEGPAPGLESAITYAVNAAERAVAQSASEEAIALLERAEAAAKDASPRLLAEVRIALGRIRIRRGQGAQGQALCLGAAETARALGDGELLARAALAYGLEITAALVNPALVAFLEESLAALPAGDSPLRARVAARLAAALQPHPDLMYPIGIARTAIESARRTEDPGTLLDVLYTGMSAMMDIVDPRERLPVNLEIEQRATAVRDTEKIIRTQARLVFDHMEIGDFVQADARIDAFERLARAASAERYLWRVPLFRSMRACIHGRFEEAIGLSEEARTAALSVQDPQLDRVYAFHHEGLLRLWERHDDMRRFDVEARLMRRNLYSGPHWQNGGSALTMARVEDEEQTRFYLGLIPDDDWPRVCNPPVFLHIGEPLALTGDAARVERAYTLLLSARGRAVSWGFTCFFWEGSTDRVLGLLAARLGRMDAARAHFEDAIAFHERLDAGPFVARTRYEYARSLCLAGDARSRDAARAEFDRARTLAERFGMSGLVALVDKRFGDAASGAPAAPAAAPKEAAPVTFTREGEYWTVSHGTEIARLKDSLGLQYLARLAETPGAAVHVLELSTGGKADGSEDVLDAGDSGELLDEDARRSYKMRLADLRETLTEAESFGDRARATKAREEIEFLAAELSRAVGLGGRARRAGGAAERARSAVQRRIKNAIDRIREASPALGARLDGCVKTGNFCLISSR